MTEIERRTEAWLWTERPGLPPPVALALGLARYAWALLEDYLEGSLSLRATSLVYASIFATAPLLAFSFSILKGLGLRRHLEPLLLDFLAPLGPRSNEITEQIIGFVNNVSGSGLASVSLLLLLVTALLMARQVDLSINFVWDVEPPRSPARRFTEYLSVMLIGPILMSVAMGIIAAVDATTLVNRLRATRPFGEALALVSAAAPYLLVMVAFILLYRFVPNARVRTRAASLGGAVAGLAWAGAGSLFTALVVNASRYQVIYSGFAIVIVTMLWLYFSWLILLLGAQLAFYIQNPAFLRRATRAVRPSNALRERLALALMALAGRAFDERRGGVAAESLASRLEVPQRLLDPVIEVLRESGLLVETVERRLVPGQDLHTITVEMILEVVRGTKGPHPGLDREAGPEVRALTDRIEQSIRDAVRGPTLADLVGSTSTDAGVASRPSSTAQRPARPGARTRAAPTDRRP